MSKIRIYTDGACSVQERLGGWAFVIPHSDNYELISGGEEDTTNNRMELLAVISGLAYISKLSNDKIDEIQIISDSAYVINAINKEWLLKWKKSGFVNGKRQPIKNVDLWKQLYKMIKLIKDYGISIEFKKIRGHAGNMFNELCDKAAKDEIKKLKESR